MGENILYYLFSDIDNEDLNEHKNKKERFYKEYEETVFDYVSNDIRLETNRVKTLENTVKLYMEEGRFYTGDTCQLIESVSPEKTAEKLFDILDEKDKVDKSLLRKKFSGLLKSVFEDIEFLSMTYALQLLFDKKKDTFTENEDYEALLGRYKKLPEIIGFLSERSNVPIEDIEDSLTISKEVLDNTIDSTESLFNVRRFAKDELISLAPKGRKVQEYIKKKQNKVYSTEEVENFIYMNSHHLLQSFYIPLSDVSDNITVIPLSPQRKHKLSFEYRFVRKELEQKKQVIDVENIFDFEIIEKTPVIDIYDIREDESKYERRKEFNRSFSRVIR